MVVWQNTSETLKNTDAGKSFAERACGRSWPRAEQEQCNGPYS